MKFSVLAGATFTAATFVSAQDAYPSAVPSGFAYEDPTDGDYDSYEDPGYGSSGTAYGSDGPVYPATSSYDPDLGYGYTTSTYYATYVATITDCPAYVTDCPARDYPVVTQIVSAYTTVCPLASLTAPYVVEPTSDAGGIYITATIYTTQEYTITSCAADVTDCPARVQYETVAAYTTICPASTYTEAAGPAITYAPTSLEVYPATTEGYAPAVSAFTAPPPNYAASSAGGIIPNATYPSTLTIQTYVPFTGGAADFGSVRCWGMAAGLAVPLLALLL